MFPERQAFDIPEGGRIVYVDCQQPRVVSFWVELEPENEVIPCYFVIIGTGHPVPDDCGYVGTILDGPFVWHLYEKKH